ncbi:hypothetical protein LR48_Vigan08g029800 [Vigna angularis]|uniref:Transposase (putative) gypsy type domain-containing protein n=1 Tax=Phaseolus angularis TaxID=3914 RepID=A0A0L9V3E9_PHAAN|nr:hypothetical protein LR48_Vigan08g029800 [Vigna angularis]
MEEKGHNTGDDMSGPSSTAECPEVITIPYGDDAFVYGNVCGEGPEGRVMSPISGDEYAWAVREVKELRSQFRSRAVIANWIENSCILRTLGYRTCIKLIACRDDERVCYSRENASSDFFYYYASPFYDLYLRFPFTTFQMDVLRTLNVAPSQLHPNSWGYVQAFAVLCRALAIRPTFFDGEGNPKFPLYWTQDPLRFTSWSEDKMTTEELEALSVLTSLPRPFSSRQLINCLEFDDAEARVFEIMGRKGSGRNWFQSIGNERVEVSHPGSSSGHAVGQPHIQVPPTGPIVLSVPTDETTTVEEQLVRKRKAKAVDTSGTVPKKRKEVAEEIDRPLPLGVWDPAFTLGHKVELNMDNSEKKVVENMTEREIADAMLEMTTRAQMLAWHMAYASDRGALQAELDKTRAQLKDLTEAHAACESKQKRSEQLLKEAEGLLSDARDSGRTLKKERNQMSNELEQAKRAMVALAKERNDLRAEAVERNELVEELKDAIMVEHTRDFQKALRQVGHLFKVSTEELEALRRLCIA